MNKPFRLALIIVLGLFLGGFALELPHAKHVTAHIFVAKVDQQAMTKEASAILIGTVLKKENTVRTTVGSDDSVTTRWNVKVEQTLKGAVPSVVVVRTDGGSYGLTVIDVEDAAKLVPGEHVLLYLEPVPGTKDFQVIGEFQGKYTLEGNEQSQVATQQETGDRLGLTSAKKLIVDFSAAE